MSMSRWTFRTVLPTVMEVIASHAARPLIGDDVASCAARGVLPAGPRVGGEFVEERTPMSCV